MELENSTDYTEKSSGNRREITRGGNETATSTGSEDENSKTALTEEDSQEVKGMMRN
jgi:hypothetical protein